MAAFRVETNQKATNPFLAGGVFELLDRSKGNKPLERSFSFYFVFDLVILVEDTLNLKALSQLSWSETVPRKFGAVWSGGR